MIKIGILYICTGAYNLFWSDFYNSCEKHFARDCEKHYFVFTDKEDEFAVFNSDRVHLKHIDNMPWPLVTLLRYHFFLSNRNELSKMDYLMFSNANMKFVKDVSYSEMMPNESKGEEIFVVAHPGYINQDSCQAPFERRRLSTAYVPYSYKEKYIIGAMNGGTEKGFLKMCETIVNSTNEDLKKNVIAKWHDESQLNHYIYSHGHYRMLTPEYCYPFGFDLPIEKKIIAVSKQAKFDVKGFKGIQNQRNDILSKINRHAKKCFSYIENDALKYRDELLKR